MSKKGLVTEFFAGANTPGGFYSCFDRICDIENTDNYFVIKGGPGTGKSSFMKRVGKILTENGHNAEYIYCSSDNESLDGVIVPSLSVAFVDGTAPHIIDPVYPGAVDKILNFGDFWNEDLIKKNKTKIIKCCKDISNSYRKAYRNLKAAKNLADNNFDTIIAFSNLYMVKKKAQNVIKREFKGESTKSGTFIPRFLTGITPQGLVTFFETAKKLSDKIYVIHDEYGLTTFFMSAILEAAKKAGHNGYICYCPMDPDGKIEHIIIPELRLSFITSNSHHKYTGDYYKSINLDRYIDYSKIKDAKRSIRENNKTYNKLMQSAIGYIKHCKQIHDELELQYNGAIDFDAVYGFAEVLAKALLKK